MAVPEVSIALTAVEVRTFDLHPRVWRAGFRLDHPHSWLRHERWKIRLDGRCVGAWLGAGRGTT
jgi:hypothetical protein